MSDGTIYTTLTQENAAFSRIDDIPTSSGVGWKQPLFIFKEQVLSLHINNDNYDKVLLMWDGGCAMRTERQHWMGGTVNCGEGVQEGPFHLPPYFGTISHPERA
ncbi:hypothetical protein BDV38DRAFT_262828 [Aspergillus pseudotamarii]|uniref:Uncharacterized protein n=1 Tax=Aspergillus pseudotamarii TaxID=132259 RepID=A0A5N6SB52_ASPPS|nr:uncharacterized protein BDV38DRAFT_262828 [Aspergillus pseudotamarii]KAE8131946.1 hypothetical protein BDV38DRAFT_262828 [Aspergillus pseudotamarii]